MHIHTQVFNVGDFVMVHICKDRFPQGTYNKMKMNKIGPYQILQKMNDNAYKVNFPTNLDISPTFNISNLYKFYGDINVF